jgi:hypothetical protein
VMGGVVEKLVNAVEFVVVELAPCLDTPHGGRG